MAADENKKIRRKVRNAYMISTVSIALVLFLLGAVSYLIMGALGATDRLKESIALNVMLEDSATEEEIAAIKQNLSAEEGIKDIRYISKEEAAREFKSYMGDDFEEFLDVNPLPNSFEITLHAKSSDKEVISALEEEITRWPGVFEIVYQRNVIDQVGTNINKFNLILLMFGATLLFISLILLNNTIRVTIFSKRNIINTMKLVGATRNFITRPFLAKSVLQGFYAGLIAWLMFTVMVMGLREGLPEINFVSDNLHLLFIYAGMMVGGILISLVFTLFAVRKFLKMNSNNIHIY